MAESLLYEPAARRLLWRGRESYLRRREAVILTLLWRHRPEWVQPDRIADALWPAQRQIAWREAVSAYVCTLAAQLVGTSARIERSGDHGTYGLGYRLTGQLLVPDLDRRSFEDAARLVT